MNMKVLAAAVVGCALLQVATMTDGAEPGKARVDSWPQWRGPARTGIVNGATWPQSLDKRYLVRQWRVEIAEGYPGPIVSADRVFTVETKDRSDEIVRAFDRRTGKQVWSAK
jgi:outer membrane protein assembly factor BamB